MVTKFEELVHGMVNIGFGAAALTAEKGKEVLDTLNAKGEQVRSDATAPDFARSMSDIFEQAGGTFSDVTERLGAKGESTAERVMGSVTHALPMSFHRSRRSWLPRRSISSLPPVDASVSPRLSD